MGEVLLDLVAWDSVEYWPDTGDGASAVESFAQMYSLIVFS